jgi:CDP-4-dehydro-6-deoxyglucose reductase
MALAEAALGRGYRQKVTLIYSCKTSDDLYDSGRLALWQTKHRNFKFVRTLTQEKGEAPVGRIPDLLPELFSDLSEHSVYVAGSPDFVDSCVDAVKKQGAQEPLIHSEGFFEQQKPETPSADRLL